METKTTVFNLIILDESGSMGSALRGTIIGCNETLSAARSLQEKFGDSQRSFVSIYAFQSGSSVPSRYLVKNAPAESVSDITDRDYQPGGLTPLLDAVGMTLTELKAEAATHEDSTGIVTIITDGCENSSKEYTYGKVAKLIDEFKEMGWTINFIGANIDVKTVASRMHISNSMAFRSDDEGSKDMFSNLSDCIVRESTVRVREELRLTKAQRIDRRKQASGDFFD